MRKLIHGPLIALAVLAIAAALLPSSRSASADDTPSPLQISPVTIGGTGTATLRFNRVALACGTVLCAAPGTGLPQFINLGSQLNGTVIFTIADTEIARWVNAQPTATTGTPTAQSGFVTTANQTARRCGFFPTTDFPFSTNGFPVGSNLGSFFGGCESVSADYVAIAAGTTTITATFLPDLPGAYGGAFGLVPNVAALLGRFGTSAYPTAVATLEVVPSPPSGVITLR